MDAPLTNAIPQIEALARQTLDRYRLPGIALGIVRDGELAFPWKQGGESDGTSSDSMHLLSPALHSLFG